MGYKNCGNEATITLSYRCGYEAMKLSRQYVHSIVNKHTDLFHATGYTYMCEAWLMRNNTKTHLRKPAGWQHTWTEQQVSNNTNSSSVRNNIQGTCKERRRSKPKQVIWADNQQWTQKLYVKCAPNRMSKLKKGTGTQTLKPKSNHGTAMRKTNGTYRTRSADPAAQTTEREGNPSPGSAGGVNQSKPSTETNCSTARQN